MKHNKKNGLIVLLLILLAWSVFINWLQNNHVSRLVKEMEDMEYIQSTLSTHIEELERTEGANYED